MEQIFETVYPEYKKFKYEIELNKKNFIEKISGINFYFSFNNQNICKKIIKRHLPHKGYEIEVKIKYKTYKVFGHSNCCNGVWSQIKDVTSGYIKLTKNEFFILLNDIGCKFDMVLPGMDTMYYLYMIKIYPDRYLKKNFDDSHHNYIDTYGNNIACKESNSCLFIKYQFFNNKNLKKKNSYFNFFMKSKYKDINLETFYEDYKHLIDALIKGDFPNENEELIFFKKTIETIQLQMKKKKKEFIEFKNKIEEENNEKFNLIFKQLDDLKIQLCQKDAELEEKNKILKKLLTTL